MNQDKVVIRSKCCSKIKDMQLSWDIITSCNEETLLKNLELIEKDNNASVFKNFQEDNQILLMQNEQILQYILHLIEAGVSVVKIEKLLAQISLNELMEYQINDTQEVLLDERINSDHMGTYLRYFLKEHLNNEELTRLWTSLFWFKKKRKNLSDDWIEGLGHKKRLFMEPIVASNFLGNINDYDGCLQLLAENQDMVSLLSMLYQIGHDDIRPDDENIVEIGRNTKRLIELWTWVKGFLNQTQLAKFLPLWLRNHALVNDLEYLKRKAKTVESSDFDTYFIGTASYVAFLYNEIIPECFDSIRENVVIYAITHRKKAFLKLVRENLELYQNISTNSVLFCQPFYDKCLNINTLNRKNLEACNNMLNTKSIMWSLLCNREHTFEELFLICNLPTQYIQLYENLSVGKVDDRIRIMREIVKRNCLPERVNIVGLAEMLSEKPLSMWMQTDFKHIRDLSYENAVCLLGESKTLAYFIPDITSDAEVRYIIGNLDRCLKFQSLSELRENILRINDDWKYLVDVFKFPKEFVSENEQRIRQFIYEDGAYIIRTYHESNIEKTEELRRLVSAELMGRFKELKYYHNDLSREIDYPITKEQKEHWIKNEKEKSGEMVVWEADGLIPVMKLGTIPYQTCLSYISGAYDQCLLACHDSNKKVLYLSCNGKIVLRASIRLTKGIYYKEENLSNSNPQLEFADFTKNENEELKYDRSENQEHLTLFLERAYISGLSQEMADKACKLILKLMKRKALGMNALLVISTNYYSHIKENVYSSYYFMYISKSKAGEQYLDSLGGNNRVDKEGNYTKGKFLFYKLQEE